MNRALTLNLRVGRRSLSQLVSAPNATALEPPIEIPKRIPRSSTDILRALADTVKADYTAAHYRFHDDPFLIPASSEAKRSFALSKESGRKAARYFLQKYPDSFKHDPAEPKIAAFNPPAKVFTHETDCTEEDLIYCIDNIRVADAEIVFKNLEAKGLEISQKTLRLLLHLTAFYNGTDQLNEDLIEERWLRQPKTLKRKVWKDGGLAEQLFGMIKDKDAEAYSTLVQGMAKHFEGEKAFALYNEMSQNGLVPSVHVYNYLIPCIYTVREGFDARLRLLTELLTDMQEKGVRPNIITFNNVLRLFSRIGHILSNKDYSLKTLVEMKRLGVEPSLATYGTLLTTFCRVQGKLSYILEDILPLIEGKTHSVRDPRDVEFFEAAMANCNEHTFDKDLAYRVNKLFEQNPHLAGDGLSQLMYYRHFLNLLCATEPLEKFMEVYYKYVPNSHTPDTSLLVGILERIDQEDAIRFLPQLWSDIVVFGHGSREKVVTPVLKLAARFRSSGSVEDNETQQRLVALVKDLRTQIDKTREAAKKKFFVFQLSALNVSNMIQTFLNGGELNEAWTSVKSLIEEEKSIFGFPEVNPLREFVEQACKAGLISQALACAKYSSNIGHETVAEYMLSNADMFELNCQTREELKSLVSKAPPAHSSTTTESATQ